MARGLIANAVSAMTGTALPTETNGDATNQHYFNNTGKTKMHARNSGAGARTVTIYISRTVAGKSVTPIIKSIPAGETHVFGPYDQNDFGTTVNVDVEHAEVKLRTVD